MTTADDIQTVLTFGDTIRRRIALVLWPVDAIAKLPTPVDVRVSIERVGTAIRNLTGHHVFSDLPSGEYVVRVEPKGRDRDRYLPEFRTVTVGETLGAPLEIALFPAPAHRFERGSTLVRGAVASSSGRVLGGVEIGIVDRPDAGRSAANGAFVLFFRARETEEDILLRFEHEGASHELDVTLTEGKSHDIGTAILPLP